MDESGDFSGDAETEVPICEVVGGPSAAMISIMVVSMVCTIASAVKTLMMNSKHKHEPPYGTFEGQGVEMLDLTVPYGRT